MQFENPLKTNSKTKLAELLKKGVKIPNPQSVEIGDDIDSDRISADNVVIHSGCKIFGSKTLILENTSLGLKT